MLPDYRKEIYDKIEKGEPVVLSFKYVSDDLLMFINSVLARELDKHDLQYLIYSVITIMRELIVNSLKANAKRIFFQSNNLDINNPQHYKEGIERYKNEVVGDFDSIRDIILASENQIKVKISEENEGFVFTIKNSVPIVPEELERINHRITIAASRDNFSDIYDSIEDETEGAGLGLALIVMFLKSINLDVTSFKIRSDGVITVATVNIPYKIRPAEITTSVKNQILDEIKGIPTFPENIILLLRMCSSDDADIDKIAQAIKHDVSVASDVIKMANSAGFITSQRVEDINRAVMKLGLKNLTAILLASNARRIMESRYTKYEEIWDHCNRVAFYSRQIAQKYRLSSSAVDSAYIAGLLHDLGQVILLSVDMKSVKKIAKIVNDKKIISSTVMEEISIGISHSEIGYLVSAKWNFPEFLALIIRYHHSPLQIPDEFREIGYCVYLANMIAGVEKRKYYYYYIEERALDMFKIKEEQEFNRFAEALRNDYAESQKRL